MKIYPSLSEDLAAFAHAQPLLLTATSPTHAPHVNLSPKGLSSHFAVLSPTTVAYVDRTGSGCETISHLYENGRLTLMFLSFGPSPRILRLFCTGRVVEYTDPAFRGYLDEIAAVRRRAGGEGRVEFEGARAVIVGDIWRVTTSCGFSVPMVPGGAEAFAERDTLDRYIAQTEKAGQMQAYQAEHNARSLDGLPGLRAARRGAGEALLGWGDVRSRAGRLWAERVSVFFGFLLAVLGYVVGRRLGLL
ncbi:pyridoxamine 5'-phosphate oxidase family protein [Candidatus Bathyarchaeota archaeon]|nr:pyridoxamine 5'-phosphate oxidase family protein [Candidatus Bathyarchaeota archaeon]